MHSVELHTVGQGLPHAQCPCVGVYKTKEHPVDRRKEIIGNSDKTQLHNITLIFQVLLSL